MTIENDVLKYLADKACLTNMSELKTEKYVRKFIEALLEIEKERFDVKIWNEACNYFIGHNENFETVRDAWYGLLLFFYKENWSFAVDQ